MSQLTDGYSPTNSADNCSSRPTPAASCGRWYDPMVVMFAIVGLYSILAILTGGRFMLEKTLTSLIQPLGICWMLLTGVLIATQLRRQKLPYRSLLWLVWLTIVATCTAPLPQWMMSRLENPLPGEYRPGVDAELGAIITFGGGVRRGPTRAELTDAGDRVLYAAQLYRQGHTQLLIATGDEGESLTQQIWLSLGVPPEHILQLAGTNTFQEIQQIRTRMPALDNARIGLLSSGFHLPRIMRLAERAGLSNVIPLAAHHRNPRQTFTLRDFVPSAGTAAKFADCQKEWLGSLIGR